jgi:3-oxoacyl-[acyl-carrier-protein] synthase-1
MTMSDGVLIAGVGMVSAVGLSASETAASVRSGTMRFSETPFRDKHFEPFTLALVPDAGLPEITNETPLRRASSREDRLLGLATRALRECLAALAGDLPRGAIPLILALPEMETRLPLDRQRFVRRIATQLGGAIDHRRCDASHTGRAGGLAAVGHAVALLQAGYAEFIIAGGVDSYVDLHVLGTLDMEQRVKSSTNLDGFIPGEGAAFLLLTRASVAATRRIPVRATLSPVALGSEAGHLYSAEPYRGDGLATTLAQLLSSGFSSVPVADVFSSMNGESHWAKEWGVGYARNRGLFESEAKMHHPADSFGDTGAASGPLMVGLAALGVAAGYRRSPSLVYASSDRGGRAALTVASA